MDPGILIIIAFIVAPLIERLLKAGKQGQDQGPPQVPQPRAPNEEGPQARFPRQGRGTGRETPEDADPPVVVSRRTEDDDAAAGMLPDDLWEILTGERRTPRETLPQPRPAPQQSYEEEEYSLESYSLEEGGSLEEQPSGEWITTSPEDDAVMLPEKIYTRPNPIRAAPKVVSLEQLEYDSEIRHDEFHDRLDSLGGPAKVRRPALSAYRFRTDEDLRRAIVMAEILGTPKGLEDMP